MPLTAECNDPQCPDGPRVHHHSWRGDRIVGPAFPPLPDNPWEQVRTGQPLILLELATLKQGLAHVEDEVKVLLKAQDPSPGEWVFLKHLAACAEDWSLGHVADRLSPPVMRLLEAVRELQNYRARRARAQEPTASNIANLESVNEPEPPEPEAPTPPRSCQHRYGDAADLCYRRAEWAVYAGMDSVPRFEACSAHLAQHLNPNQASHLYPIQAREET